MYKKVVAKVLSDKKKLLKEADSCNFFKLYKENQDLAFRRLYQGLNLNFRYATKVEKNAIKVKFRKTLFKPRDDVSLLNNSLNNKQRGC